MALFRGVVASAITHHQRQPQLLPNTLCTFPQILCKFNIIESRKWFLLFDFRMPNVAQGPLQIHVTWFTRSSGKCNEYTSSNCSKNGVSIRTTKNGSGSVEGTSSPDQSRPCQLAPAHLVSTHRYSTLRRTTGRGGCCSFVPWNCSFQFQTPDLRVVFCTFVAPTATS